MKHLVLDPRDHVLDRRAGVGVVRQIGPGGEEGVELRRRIASAWSPS